MFLSRGIFPDVSRPTDPAGLPEGQLCRYRPIVFTHGPIFRFSPHIFAPQKFKFVADLEKCKQKMSHEPVKFPQLSDDKAASKL